MTGAGRDDEEVDLEALEKALDRLLEFDPQLARVVELRCAAGLSLGEIAKVLDIPEHRLERQWQMIRIWLSMETS